MNRRTLYAAKRLLADSRSRTLLPPPILVLARIGDDLGLAAAAYLNNQSHLEMMRNYHGAPGQAVDRDGGRTAELSVALELVIAQRSFGSVELWQHHPYQAPRRLKMPTKVKRTLRKDVLRKRDTLPASLTFLNSISFHSLLEDRTGTRTQFRVEIATRTLKGVLTEVESLRRRAEPNDRELEEAHAQTNRYKRELEQVKLDLEEQRRVVARLNRTIEERNQRIGKHGVTKSSGAFKLHISDAEKLGYKSNGLPLQGGLPSLGKRRR